MITVEVVFATPQRQQLLSLSVPKGTTARELAIDVIKRALICVSDEVPDALLMPIGVYGELVEDSYALQDGDRLEIYRALQQDPKERRRQRAGQKSGR